MTAWIHAAKITKKYIIDMLNSMFLEKSVHWTGEDQFHKLVLLDHTDDGGLITESRGAFLVHAKLPWAIRILVTKEEDSSQRVCYRVTTIKDRISFSDPHKNCLPPSELQLDFSIADLNLGLSDWTSYSFCDNLYSTCNSDTSDKERLFNLLKFMLDSSVHTKDDISLFEDLVGDGKNYPPIAGDLHYSAIYSQSVSEDGE